MEIYDYVVIGAGIAGVSSAWELSKIGSTVLLERESVPGYHSSGRSAAFFSEAYGNADVRRLNVASRPDLEHPPEELGGKSFLSARGALFVAREDQRDRLLDYYEDARLLVKELVLVDRDFIAKRVPVLNEAYSLGLWEPGAMEIDVACMMSAYLAAFKKRGGSLICEAQVDRLESGQTYWSVGFGDRQIAGRVVVNASGAWGDDIARLAGVAPLNLQPLRRTVITFDPPTGLDVAEWPLVIDIDEEFYFKPEAGRILASSANEDLSMPCDVQAEELDIAIAVDAIERATSFRVSHVRSKWAGLRTFAPGRSIVSQAADTDGKFILCCGQGGYGFQTAPEVARLVANSAART